jgi:hypothetical protein
MKTDLLTDTYICLITGVYLVGCLFLAGCEAGCEVNTKQAEIEARKPVPLQVNEVSELEPGKSRFEIQSHGKFNAGYDHGLREILTITDRQTGKQYLGITGVGITELRQERSGDDNAVKER